MVLSLLEVLFLPLAILGIHKRDWDIPSFSVEGL